MLVFKTDIMLYGRSLSSFLTDIEYEMFTKLLWNRYRVMFYKGYQ